MLRNLVLAVLLAGAVSLTGAPVVTPAFAAASGSSGACLAIKSATGRAACDACVAQGGTYEGAGVGAGECKLPPACQAIKSPLAKAACLKCYEDGGIYADVGTGLCRCPNPEGAAYHGQGDCPVSK